MSQAKEIQNLQTAIQNALKAKKYDGLLETVNRYLLLKPGDASALKLQQRLSRRQKSGTATGVAPHSLFLSHSSRDKTVADALCATLEEHGIRCWIAPRNIAPGTDYGESIIDAISAARVMVVIISSNSNESSQVKREIERAINKDLTVIPFFIEDLPLSKSLEYYLSTAQRLDAFHHPLNHHLSELVACVAPLISHQPNEVEPPSASDHVVTLDHKDVVPVLQQQPVAAVEEIINRCTAGFSSKQLMTRPRIVQLTKEMAKQYVADEESINVFAFTTIEDEAAVILREFWVEKGELDEDDSLEDIFTGKAWPVETIVSIERAIKSFAPFSPDGRRLQQDNVLLLWDNSLMEDGKSGILLSDNALYWKSSMFDTPHSLSYDSIINITISAKGTLLNRAEIRVNSQPIKIFSGPPVEAMNQFAAILESILTQVMPVR